jgi:hypothetical protein
VTSPTPIPAPTLTGFQSFITNVMQIPSGALPLSAPVVGYAFNVALIRVNLDLNFAGTYTLAVYNLAGSLLLNFAPDQPNSTYFADLRGENGYNLTAFVAGVVAASGDEGTSTSILTPEFFRSLTMDDLQRLKDPYGRQYLAFAQEAGPTIWGLS